MKSLLPFLLAPITLTACDDAIATPDLPPREACVLAVIASDYLSTAVSLLTSDGTLCAPDIVTSGSRPPGLLTALSGDVVLPSEPDPAGLLYLIDRFPNAVVTTLDPLTSEVLTQLAVSPGFAGNPYDIAFLAPSPTFLLTRFGSDPDDPDGQGSDLLRVAAETTRIDLSAYADPGFEPMPDQLARAAGHLWVGLTHLTADFSRAAPGRALALDPNTLAMTHSLDLDPLQNCGTIVASSPTAGLWVVCSGLFRASPTGPQGDHSGLAWLSPSLTPATPSVPNPSTPIPLTPTWLRLAADLHPPGTNARPLGFTLAALDDDRALIVALGDLATKLPDRLLLVTRSTDTVTTLAESDGPYELGAVLPRPANGPAGVGGLILVADANPRTPRVRRFTWPTATTPSRELSPVAISPSGLPPRHIAVIR